MYILYIGTFYKYLSHENKKKNKKLYIQYRIIIPLFVRIYTIIYNTYIYYYGVRRYIIYCIILYTCI